MIVNKRYKLVALHKCKYICNIKAKTAEILKFIKTFLTVKTYIFVTMKTSSKTFVAKYFIKRQLVYVMKSLELLRKKLDLLEQNATIIIIVSKIKLPEKIINLLRKQKLKK